MRKNWRLLFERLDIDGSGRLDYDEFAAAVRGILMVPATDDELRGLWAYIDHDGSGQATIEEFQHACYLLLLEGWPSLEDGDLTRLCGALNDAAVREYRADGGNWFKIFTFFDTDESGRLGFEELEGVARMRDPGLNLRDDDVDLDELRGLWKAIDKDSSGDVTVDEFMHFMRANAADQFHEITDYSRAKRGLDLKGPYKNPALNEKGETRAEKLKRLAGKAAEPVEKETLKAVAKKATTYHQPKRKPPPYAGPTNRAEASGRAIAFSTDDDFIARYSDARTEDDGTRAMLHQFADAGASKITKPTSVARRKKKTLPSAPVTSASAPDLILEAPAKPPPPKVTIVREPGAEPCSDPALDPVRKDGPPKTPLAPRPEALSADYHRKVAAEKAKARKKEIERLPLADALRELMADWKESVEGGAILKHVPALPLHIFDDADHADAANRAGPKCMFFARSVERACS